MRSASRLVGSFLALAVLAAPVAGLCVSLVESEDPCEMQETREMAACGHGEMLMSACCTVQAAEPAPEAILPGSGSDVEPPAIVRTGFDVSVLQALEAAVLACDGDPPPAVPRYRLFSALLL